MPILEGRGKKTSAPPLESAGYEILINVYELAMQIVEVTLGCSVEEGSLLVVGTEFGYFAPLYTLTVKH